MGKRVKWPIKELFADKLILRTIENERIESICEPEKGPLLGEGDSNEEMIYTDQYKRKVLVASSQTRESHIFGINYLCECKFAGMKPNEFEHVHEKVKEAETRKTQKEIHKEFQDFNWWRKLKGMSEWLCILLLKTYWIRFKGILTWIENQWKMNREKEINALQICEVKGREADIENSAQKVKSRKNLKDRSLVIEERKTLLSYLDKLGDGENCVEHKGILQTYDEVAKHSQEAAVQEVFFDEK